jgi:hypothetical protein
MLCWRSVTWAHDKQQPVMMTRLQYASLFQVQALLMAQQRYMERMGAKEVSSAPAQPGF